MSHTDAIVIAVFMGLSVVVAGVLVASLVWREKARSLWFTTGFILLGGFSCWLITTAVFASIIQNRPAMLLICLMPLAMLGILTGILFKTGLYGSRGKTILMALVLMVGAVAGYGQSGSMRNASQVRATLSPLLQKSLSSAAGELNPQPWFILYDEDARALDFSKSGVFSRYSTDPKLINTVVSYRKSTSHVGTWETIQGVKVAEAVVETIHVTVIDTASWSVVDRKRFEAVGEPAKDRRTGVYTQKIAITDSTIKGYLRDLLMPPVEG